jgi:hypothetical protein
VLPGKTISATVPLSAEAKTYASIGGNRIPTSTVATLAGRPGFDPRKSWPVLIVFSTSTPSAKIVATSFLPKSLVHAHYVC